MRLVLLKDSLEWLEHELSTFPWDCENALVTVSRKNLVEILTRRVEMEIDDNTIIRWANALECREDLNFEDTLVEEIIFELANPEINGVTTNQRVLEMIDELNVHH